MRFIIDMNLSPAWTEYLNERGHDAVHWANVGQPDAADAEIVSWARRHDRVILTTDLDFGAILALSASTRPSVIQLRTDATLPTRIGSFVLSAIEQASEELRLGALLTVEIERPRLRILPLQTDD